MSNSRLQNQILVIALANGDIIMKAPYEDNPSHILLKHETGFDNIVAVVGPQSNNEDPSFIVVLNGDGRLKVMNFTVIENHQSYTRYAKDNFGIKGNMLSPNSTKRIEDTP
jgi:hypothetical protein